MTCIVSLSSLLGIPLFAKASAQAYLSVYLHTHRGSAYKFDEAKTAHG